MFRNQLPHPRQRLILQGVKLYYRYQVYSTRPDPKNSKRAVVRVQNLETGQQFRIDTRSAVLNVPAEVSLVPVSFSLRDISTC